MIVEFLEGFSPSSVEIVLFVLLVIAFFGGLVWFAAVSRRREERRQIAAAERRYEQLVDSMGLSPSGRATVERLTGYLRDRREKHLLLQNHTVYDRCVDRAVRDGAVSGGEAAALRVRLGFSGEPSGAEPDSSTEIPPGSGLAIVDAHDRTIPARLLEHTPSSFLVETDEEAPRLTSGNLVEVVYQNGSGVYRFESGVLANPPGRMELSHAEELERVQRRRYYRGSVRLPVYVRLAGDPDRPTQTRLVDIGGGGASFLAPDPRFQRGEQVELTFHPDSSVPLHLPGRIVRESNGGKTVHVRFEELPASTRDRVLGFLFRREPRRGG